MSADARTADARTAAVSADARTAVSEDQAVSADARTAVSEDQRPPRATTATGARAREAVRAAVSSCQSSKNEQLRATEQQEPAARTCFEIENSCKRKQRERAAVQLRWPAALSR